MKNWIKNSLYFIKFSFKDWKTVLKYISTAFAPIGLYFSIAQIVESTCENKCMYSFFADNWWWFSLLSLFLAYLVYFREKRNVTYYCENLNASITIKIGDIFHSKGDLIIPTNSCFETSMDNGFISPSSVQGQYQLRFFKGDMVGLNNQIQIQLKEKSAEHSTDRIKATSNQYPLGTLVKVSAKRNAYFFADSHINDNGIPYKETLDELEGSLNNLWVNLSQIANKEVWNIPLVGMGKATLADADYKKVLRAIVQSFVSICNSKGCRTQHLTIYITPKDFISKDMQWKYIKDYLPYFCEYPD